MRKGRKGLVHSGGGAAKDCGNEMRHAKRAMKLRTCLRDGCGIEAVIPQGLKPQLFRDRTARLESCPDGRPLGLGSWLPTHDAMELRHGWGTHFLCKFRLLRCGLWFSIRFFAYANFSLTASMARSRWTPREPLTRTTSPGRSVSVSHRPAA